MAVIFRSGVVLALSAMLAACGSPADQSDAPGTDAAMNSEEAAGEQSAQTGEASADTGAAARPAAFAQCVTCHSVEPGKHGIGPSLANMMGTKAGDIPGFNFSPALKESGLVWNDETLDQWLASPRKLVPGTRMAYAGMSNPAQRKEVIEYIKTLK